MASTPALFTRAQLAQFLPDPKAIKAFEALQTAVADTTPADIAELTNNLQVVNISTETTSFNADLALGRIQDLENRVDALSVAPLISLLEEPAYSDDGLLPPSVSPVIIGEYYSATAATVAIATSTYTNITSLVLPAGTWDVQATLLFTPAATTVITTQVGSVGTTSAALGSLGQYFFLAMSAPAGRGSGFATPVSRITLASSATVYAVAGVDFTISTCTVSAFLRATRATQP